MKLSVLIFSFLVFPLSQTQAQTPGGHESNRDRSAWMDRLRSEFRVEVLEDDPKVFDGDLLHYLHDFLSSSPRNPSPIRLHATRKSGARKVWRRDEWNGFIDLYFAKDAGSGLYSKGASEIRERFDGQLEKTVDYHSDLFLQLSEALYPQSQLQKTLLDSYHISTDCSGVSEPCDSFKKRELLAILGIFQDLPIEIRQNLRLNRMIRLPDGVSNLLDLKAVASYSNGVIRVTSRAFEVNGDRMGEGTLVHELGHAIWPALSHPVRQSYFAISWMRSAQSGEEKIKPGTGEFVSEYALTSVEEDFAEHFSAYFNQPELLGQHAPSKREWLKSKVFINTEYYSTAASNLRVYVSSNSPDTEPPGFLNGISKKLIKLTPKTIESQIEIHVQLKDLVDDVSGFRSAELHFITVGQSPGGSSLFKLIVSGLESRQDIADQYLQVLKFERKDLPSQTMRLYMIRLEDYAGNWEYQFVDHLGIQMDLEGTATQVDLYKTSYRYENERQRKLRSEIEGNLNPLESEIKVTPGSETGVFILHLPKQVDEQSDRLLSGSARFLGVHEFRSGQFRTVVHNHEEELDYKFGRNEIDLSKTENGFDLVLDMRRGVNFERMSLYWVTLHYRSLDWDVYLNPKDEDPFVIEPHSVGSDPTPAEIEINDIGIDLQKSREEGKDELILKTRLPLNGFENGGKLRVVYQTPSGKQVVGGSGEIKIGASEAEVEIRLNQYREEGEYIIREIQIMENSPPGSNPAIEQGAQFRVQKVMSRGVRKTVVIDKPLPPS
ncbi:MAG: hypothetical protein KGP28_03775 [Bdellovibrionales bacterium]|nr:hypothetical protein [Bdellovibrionales bacterium]